MITGKIPEPKTLNWKDEEGTVIVNNGQELLVLNSTCSLIWRKINGLDTVEEIIADLKSDYPEEDELEELVKESLALMMDYGLVLLKEDTSFDGWLLYDK